MLVTIFNHQTTLMSKYHVIEQMNLRRELPDPNKINIDLTDDQLRLKEFAWRITEELAEATECLHDGSNIDELHFLEELVDALHFSIEFNIMSKVAPEDIMSRSHYSKDRLEQLELEFRNTRIHQSILGTPGFTFMFKTNTWFCVEALGRAMNTLKNKPWKSTHMVTDRAEYRKIVLEFNYKLFNLMWLAGLTAKSLTQLYLNKNAVNQFRIASNY